MHLRVGYNVRSVPAGQVARATPIAGFVCRWPAYSFFSAGTVGGACRRSDQPLDAPMF
jgi:hypothetical protein